MTPTEIKQLLERYGLRPVKDRGQNFLLDDSVVKTMADEASVVAGDNILEVGPGFGVLTEELLNRGAQVTAVELDPGLANILRDRFADRPLKIMEGDFLRFSLAELTAQLGTSSAGSYKVIANLPYAITSDALKKCLTEAPRPHSVTVMVQREVAERAVAQPPDSGLLSIVMRTYGRPKILLKVPAASFWPAPKVDSAVLHIPLKTSEEIAEQLSGLEPEKFLSAVRQAFTAPRKKIQNTLGQKYASEKLTKAFTAAKISSDLRPERVSFEQWVKLVPHLMR
ncbi:MAG: 16S rRNA (adenine(1518)-N(6)/adenine(1519)-N(6))-dimethyltransferase RsmA [Patescibacteria group bacterium]